jgi:hypothetical protein
MLRYTIALILLLALVSSCKKEEETSATKTPSLVFKFKFDSTQVRLNNLGQSATMPSGHAAQSPVFHKMGAHYVELAQTANTQVGSGEVLYHAPETTSGGASAIDFSKSNLVKEGDIFLSIPISDIAPGSYDYLRVSLSYQNYDIKYRFQNPITTNYEFANGRIASFVGYNTYLTSFKVKDNTIAVNGNRLQGYWGFESTVYSNTTLLSGQSNGTTVPNPISTTSPIPSGSCLVTGQFINPLVISGNETDDVVIIVSLSTNQSVEWYENIVNGHFDLPGDSLVDMGLRGLIPILE